MHDYLEEYEDELFEFDRVPYTYVRHLRLDVDMDSAYGEGPCNYTAKNYSGRNPSWVHQELFLERAALYAMGLCAHFFRTGRRGHQIVIPTPFLDRSVASLALLLMKHLLSSIQREPGRAKIDKSNLDCLLRLPLGRHTFGSNIAWFIDPDTGKNIPLEQQAQALEAAWLYNGQGCETLAESADEISYALKDMGYDRDCDITAGVHDHDISVFLTRILSGLPSCPFMDAYKAAARQFLPDDFVWEDFPLRQEDQAKQGQPSLFPDDIFLDGVFSDTAVPDSAIPDAHNVNAVTLDILSQGAENIYDSPTGIFTDRLVSQPEETHRKLSVKQGTGWAQKVIDEGFRPGQFYSWSRSDGKNGIGAAIILWGREQAAEKLIEYVQKVDANARHMRKREDWIRWAVPRNNIREYNETSQPCPHRDLMGTVLEIEGQRGEKVVEALIQRRRVSAARRKTFDVKALVTIQHIIELIQVEARNTDDGLLRLSFRTFAAGIKARWPEHGTNQEDIKRQMKWIVEGPGCLFSVLEAVKMPRTPYQATAYALGADFLALLSE